MSESKETIKMTSKDKINNEKDDRVTQKKKMEGFNP